MMDEANRHVSPPARLEIRFSRGWLWRFQKRWRLRSFKSHGESGDVDETAANDQLPILQRRLSRYEKDDVFNADESGLCFHLAPDRTIAKEQLKGRKKQN